VSSSAGTPGRARRHSAPSAAARYRELRANRAIYALAVVVLSAPWAIWLAELERALATRPALLAADHVTLTALVRFQLATFVQGSPPIGAFDLFAAAALGIALFAYDRVVGGLFYSLEGPLGRREVFWAKALYGAGTILLVLGVGTLATLAAAAASGNLALAGGILLRTLFEASGQLSLFATALAMGGAMGTVFSSLATAIWAGLPALGQGLVFVLFWVHSERTVVANGTRVLVFGMEPVAPWLGSLTKALPNLSPFQPGGFPGWSTPAVLALVAWFLAWTVLIAGLGATWWERAPFERLWDGVFFPKLWNAYYAFLALATALFVVTLVTHGTVVGLGWAALMTAVAVPAWLFWRAALTHRRRRPVG
jgi:hypothetical protein